MSDVVDNMISIEPKKSKKDISDFKKNINIQPCSRISYVIAFVIHNVDDKNKMERIYCDRGEPLGGYVYDSVNDSYFISCLDWIPLGYIPVSFKMTFEDAGFWEVDIPMPEAVLKKYLKDVQKKDLERFLDLYSKEDCKYKFLQFVVDA